MHRITLWICIQKAFGRLPLTDQGHELLLLVAGHGLRVHRPRNGAMHWLTLDAHATAVRPTLASSYQATLLILIGLKMTHMMMLIGLEILKEIIETKFQEWKSQETNNADPLFVPENIRSLRNRNVIVYSQDAQSKFLINTFCYFSQTFLKCFKLDIFNLNYNQFFKEVATNINNICTSLINHFAKFNLALKCFYLVKDKIYKLYYLTFLFHILFFYFYLVFIFHNKWVNQSS